MLHKFSVEVKGVEREVTVEPLDGGRYRVTHGGTSRVVDARKVADTGRATTWSILPEGGGAATLVDVDGLAPDLTVTVANVSVPLKLQPARNKVAGAAAPRPRDTGPTHIKSPMPGKLVKMLIKVGDTVTAGQGIAVVEAMKMENELKSPRDGKVQALAVQEGQAVDAGQTLATLA